MNKKIEIRNLTSNKIWEYENGFMHFANESRLAKFILQYELFQKSKNVPGDIFEFGVHKTNSLRRFCIYRNLVGSELSKKIIGFDFFGEFKFDANKVKSDENFVYEFEKATGGCYSLEQCQKILDFHKTSNITLVKGDVKSTLPKYLSENPQTRVSFLNLDMDIYEPTKFVLETLYPRLTKGAIILIDDYNAVEGQPKLLIIF